MSSFTKSLFRLTVVTFVCAMLMPVTTTRAGPPNAEGCHPHKGDCPDDPVVEASEYTVTFSGNLTSVVSNPPPHDDWLVATSGHRSIDFQAHIMGNDMTLDLRFFSSMDTNSNCFTLRHPAEATPIFGAGITKRNIKGGIKQAWAGFWFQGQNRTDQDLHYLLEIFGTFASDDTWPSTQDLTMTKWEITTASGAGDAAQGACIGEGPFVGAPMVTIVVTAHEAGDSP